MGRPASTVLLLLRCRESVGSQYEGLTLFWSYSRLIFVEPITSITIEVGKGLTLFLVLQSADIR